MNNPTTYMEQLAARAAEMLPGAGQQARLCLAALDPGEAQACLAFIIGQYPAAFDHALVRDRDLVDRLYDRLDDADDDQDGLEPYCAVCGARIGIFYGQQDKGYQHYRGEGTVASPVVLYAADDHTPAVSWAPAGGR